MEREETARLLERIRDGSAEAFDCLYERTAPMVKALAVRWLGDPMEAEDVCHDVFLHVIKHPERYDPYRGSVEAWLAVLARSRSYDRLRKRKKWLLGAEDSRPEEAVAAAPEERVLSKLQREALRLAMEELPRLQRTAVAEAFLAERSQRELARTWEMPLGTVKSRIRYGLHHLRKALSRRGWAETEGGDPHG